MLVLTFGGPEAGVVTYTQMIFTSAKGRRCLGCFQISPAPEAGSSAWRTPEMAEIQSCNMLEQKFELRANYDPFDTVNIPTVHFSVPTKDGRQRWVDAGKPKDKTAISKH